MSDSRTDEQKRLEEIQFFGIVDRIGGHPSHLAEYKLYQERREYALGYYNTEEEAFEALRLFDAQKEKENEQ